MQARVPSGLRKSDEVSGRALLRDTRTISKKIADYLAVPRNSARFIIFMAAVALLFYSASDLLILVAWFVYWNVSKKPQILPFRLPMHSKMMDFNDPMPGTDTPRLARGIYFYGNEGETKQELWFNNEDMRTHTLMFGSTGSGKTEGLISIAFNALLQGSGFIYVDGKGDNSLFAKIFSLARFVGREDDVLIINFLTGARDIIGPQERRLSNTLNPFANGSSSMLAQLVVTMMSTASHTPDGDMWKGRAIAFIEALMKFLVYMRDTGKILLDASTIRRYFTLEYLESIVIDKVFPRFDQEPVSLTDVPTEVIDPLYNYIINLPGYDKSRKGRQVSQVLEQHGFITMQLVRVFTSLADTYGHIMKTNLAEVDLKDVVLNRRILVVLLPALEKSPDELANLGKVIISTLKTMMAAGLGEEVEGGYKDLIVRKPTNAPNPFLCILDEYGYYAVQGFAVVPAQARSLGFSVIFAGQDLPAFQKASKEEAASIGANTNIKIAMKLEDPLETAEFFMKTAGNAFVTKSDSFGFDPNSLVFTYKDMGSATVESRARITMKDLKEQREGECHIFFKSGIVRAKIFRANPPPVEKLRLNHFLRIEEPSSRKLAEFEQHIDRFAVLVDQNDLNFTVPEFSPEVDFLVKTFKEDSSGTLIEQGVSTLLAYYNRSVGKTVEEETPIKVGEIDIFSRAVLNELATSIIPPHELEGFSAALLQKKICSQRIQLVERLFGKTEAYSINIAEELVRDMELATHYPPAVKVTPLVSEIVAAIHELSEAIKSMK